MNGKPQAGERQVARPAFIVSVTGTRRLGFSETPQDARDAAEAALRVVFRWLTGKQEAEDAAAAAVLGRSPRLRHTPLHVYSPLAAGADQLVAKVAEEFGCTLFAPLPFDPETYLASSTFQDENGHVLADAQEFAKCKLQELQPAGRAFAVRIAEDEDLDEHAFLDRLKADAKCANRRHLRYRAVGEYVAAYSHVMIALTEKPVCVGPAGDAFPVALKEDNPEAGAKAIVAVKRLGMTPGLLSRTFNVVWSDLGPVIHIHTPVCLDVRAEKEKAGRIEVLFPYDAKPIGETCHLDAQWQRLGWERFNRTAATLEEFNRNAKVDEEREKGEVREMCGSCCLDAVQGMEKEAAEIARHEFGAFDELARVRRRAASRSASHERHSLRVAGWLFALTFLGAVALHFAWHWHAPHQEAATARAVDEPSDAIGVAEMGLFTGCAVMIGPCCFLLAYGISYWFKRTEREQQRHDARALAEGLRVQFYWALAGLGRSVPANYMERQRGELSWIRQAIRSLASPYFRYRVWFERLDRHERRARLRCVLDKWIIGQRDYYSREFKNREHRLHVHHHMGFGLAAAGLGNLLLMVGLFFWPSYLSWDLAISWLSLIVASLVIVSMPIVGLIGRRRERTQNEEAGGKGASKRERSPGERAEGGSAQAERPSEGLSQVQPQGKQGPGRFARIARWMNGLTATAAEVWAACEWSNERLFKSALPAKIGELFAYVALAIFWPLVSFLLCAGLHGIASHHIPVVWDLLVIETATLLLAGAMYIAWAEKQLHAEHSRQYNEMGSLYHAASRRLQAHLDAADAALHSGHDELFDKHIHAMQDILYLIGLQALDETAEWLILHRARPLEPVMAG